MEFSEFAFCHIKKNLFNVNMQVNKLEHLESQLHNIPYCPESMYLSDTWGITSIVKYREQRI